MVVLPSSTIAIMAMRMPVQRSRDICQDVVLYSVPPFQRSQLKEYLLDSVLLCSYLVVTEWIVYASTYALPLIIKNNLASVGSREPSHYLALRRRPSGLPAAPALLHSSEEVVWVIFVAEVASSNRVNIYFFLFYPPPPLLPST